MNIQMILNSGKNPKWKYYLAAYARELVPASILRKNLSTCLREIESRPDRAEIFRRTDYYCCLNRESCHGWQNTVVNDTNINRDRIGGIRLCRQSVYYHDLVEYTRYFNTSLLINWLPGDITYIPEVPAVVKSRPIARDGSNGNSILLNLDKVRHFIFIKDQLTWDEKQKDVLFRGKIGGKRNRVIFMERFYGRDGYDVAIVNTYAKHPEWTSEKITLWQQLRHAAIMSIEGNDVASNLKWIMSSNSLAVSPRLRYETWFMEGTLIGGEHYVEVADDYSDLDDKMEYYFSHPKEAKEIISNAHRYVSHFQDSRREKLISLLTLQRYLSILNG